MIDLDLELIQAAEQMGYRFIPASLALAKPLGNSLLTIALTPEKQAEFVQYCEANDNSGLIVWHRVKFEDLSENNYLDWIRTCENNLKIPHDTPPITLPQFE